ncbi:UDP-N-acetylmuramoyl-L-alanine--D-glutamate ligase [Termitidicoccus mucosus]|uniref:UDP-N-acetylmuramoylalanine--D-glutamate ligase n=1 Tax=Termitidicoccus mucosus TaxID=1184151 RepID=A0A178INW6_9BACT|nr:UDP-N-acetylmuramoylalanine--D-glutamate ligase [Opitutaceae bacterium TSB47]
MPFLIHDFIKPLLAQPVAVLGGGVSGRAVMVLLEKLGAQGALFDERQEGARREFTEADARAHRLVVFSPGFVPAHPWLETARAAGCECLGELDFAALFWRGTIIAITGTNGKTTLTEFLTHALQSTKRHAGATGNVGHPFSALVAEREGGVFDEIAVCEVSSFQAEVFKYFRADSAFWINIAEDHLERHPGMAAYFEAKWRLFDRTVGGVMLAGSSVRRFAESCGRVLPPDACVETEGQPADVLLRGTVFEHYPQRENFLMAAAWWHRAGLPETALYEAARSFRPARHRLSRVAERGGVTWWNDSKATNFHAVEGALTRFTAPVLLIAGGKSKGGDIAAFVARIAPRVKHAFLIGDTAPVLAAACRARGVPHTSCATLAYAVQQAAENAAGGDAVLLSPGFASFDMFRSYQDRGDQFEQLVRDLPAPSISN